MTLPTRTNVIIPRNSGACKIIVDGTNCGARSGVQRQLDARGQRGSWMPSKIFSIRHAKFLTTFFSHFFQMSHLFA